MRRASRALSVLSVKHGRPGVYRLTIRNSEGLVSPKSLLPAREALQRWVAEEDVGNKVTCRNRSGDTVTRAQIEEAAGST